MVYTVTVSYDNQTLLHTLYSSQTHTGKHLARARTLTHTLSLDGAAAYLNSMSKVAVGYMPDLLHILGYGYLGQLARFLCMCTGLCVCVFLFNGA